MMRGLLKAGFSGMMGKVLVRDTLNLCQYHWQGSWISYGPAFSFSMLKPFCIFKHSHLLLLSVSCMVFMILMPHVNVAYL